jgi:hypothetical protein
VSHFLGDGGHREHLFVVERGEKKKLGERNIARRKFLAEVQHKAALHFHDNVRQPLGVRSKRTVLRSE